MHAKWHQTNNSYHLNSRLREIRWPQKNIPLPSLIHTTIPHIGFHLNDIYLIPSQFCTKIVSVMINFARKVFPLQMPHVICKSVVGWNFHITICNNELQMAFWYLTICYLTWKIWLQLSSFICNNKYSYCKWIFLFVRKTIAHVITILLFATSFIGNNHILLQLLD